MARFSFMVFLMLGLNQQNRVRAYRARDTRTTLARMLGGYG